MIKVNGKKFEGGHFPDGSQMILNFMTFDDSAHGITFDWHYESDEELVTLMFLSKHCRDKYPYLKQHLSMMYIPNARMDRTKSISEVFTLKYFCEIINSLNFESVIVKDAHSDVSVALLDRTINLDPAANVWAAIFNVIESSVSRDDIVIYFPDAGAFKRYSNLSSVKDFPKVYGVKNRDWRTGEILGLSVETNGVELEGKTVIMIDDIIAYGGSLYYSAKHLKELGVADIYAYATHTENSVLNREKGTLLKALEDGTVTKLFTTDSIYRGTHPNIKVV